MSDLGSLCNCDCDPDCGDNCELYQESTPTARKEHICCECRKTIKNGEKYRRIEGKWEGDFETYKQCMGCGNLSKELCAPLGDLTYALKDCIGEDIDIEEDG